MCPTYPTIIPSLDQQDGGLVKWPRNYQSEHHKELCHHSGQSIRGCDQGVHVGVYIINCKILKWNHNNFSAMVKSKTVYPQHPLYIFEEIHIERESSHVALCHRRVRSSHHSANTVVLQHISLYYYLRQLISYFPNIRKGKYKKVQMSSVRNSSYLPFNSCHVLLCFAVQHLVTAKH